MVRNPGIFPINLVGQEMKFWYEQNLPYPDEICMMWNALIDSDESHWASQHKYMALTSESGRTLAARDYVLEQMGFSEKDWHHNWMLDPANHHSSLRNDANDNRRMFRKKGDPPKPKTSYRPPRSAALAQQIATRPLTPVLDWRGDPKIYPYANPMYSEKTVAGWANDTGLPAPGCDCESCTSIQQYKAAKAAKDSLDRFSEQLRQDGLLGQVANTQAAYKTLPLEAPNPPRIGKLQVREITNGQTTIHPLSYPLVMLKDPDNWKYQDTVTIDEKNIDAMIRELLTIKQRIEDRRGGK